jgi:uncharacterized protein (DUF4213/DUF364 family)
LWELYRKLIENIPEHHYVEEFIVGVDFTFVKSNYSLGLAKTLRENRFPMKSTPYKNMPLKELAAGIYSWNNVESSLGLAAINAYYNSNEYLDTIQYERMNVLEFRDKLLTLTESKKVTMIGHNLLIEQEFFTYCDLTHLTLVPIEDEYPITASEFLLPESEIILLPGSSISNKTVERYLELSHKAFVMMIDIDAVLSPDLLYQHSGLIASPILNDAERCIYHVKTGQNIKHLWKTGDILCIKQTKEQERTQGL